MKKFTTILLATISTIVLTGCGKSQPEGTYQCDIKDIKSSEKIEFATIKINENNWDMKFRGTKDKWLTELFMSTLTKNDSANFDLVFDESSKMYSLNVNGTNKGAKQDVDFLNFMYDENKNELELHDMQGIKIEQKLKQKVSCQKKS